MEVQINYCFEIVAIATASSVACTSLDLDPSAVATTTLRIMGFKEFMAFIAPLESKQASKVPIAFMASNTLEVIQQEEPYTAFIKATAFITSITIQYTTAYKQARSNDATSLFSSPSPSQLHPPSPLSFSSWTISFSF